MEGSGGPQIKPSRPIYTRIIAHLHQFWVWTCLTLFGPQNPINQARLLHHGSHLECQVSNHVTIPVGPTEHQPSNQKRQNLLTLKLNQEGTDFGLSEIKMARRLAQKNNVALPSEEEERKTERKQGGTNARPSERRKGERRRKPSNRANLRTKKVRGERKKL